MGFLIYGGTQEYEFDDRTLAHLKVVLTMKLRLQESFLVSWINPAERGGGRFSIWLSPSIPLAFRFVGGRAPELNRDWIEALTETSNGSRGLVVLSESEAQQYLSTRRGSVGQHVG
ncbi:hypothetical protein U6G28_02795 [Actinomycetaceae bacterium MB13-C1-2]|nr:hypothetical protein U6G28_02795 [Actinomycetaceae bacterium MB13-C1-2]